MPGQPSAQVDESEAKKAKLGPKDERNMRLYHKLGVGKEFDPAFSSIGCEF